MKRLSLMSNLLVLSLLIFVVPKLNAKDKHSNDDAEFSRILTGLKISPVRLNLKGKNLALVGLGSYIVNAQGGCNDCHTCPSYKPGHNPFPPPFGVGGDGQINAPTYLAGGVDFGPPGNIVTSANLTPDANGRPEGLTLEQFHQVGTHPGCHRTKLNSRSSGGTRMHPWWFQRAIHPR